MPSNALPVLAASLALAACAGAPKTGAPPPPAAAAPVEATATPLAAPAAPMWTDVAAVEGHCAFTVAEVEQHRAAVKAAEAKDEASVLAPFNQLMFALDHGMGRAALIGAVHPDKPVRTAAETCEQTLSKLASEISLDRALYDAVSAVDARALGPGGQRFVEKVLEDFTRSGVDKDDETRTRLKALDEEMVKVGQAFGRAIREGSRAIEVAPQDLDGMPADFVKAHAPTDAGKVVLTTDYPDFFPIQTYAKEEDVRRRLYAEFLNRGYPENDANLKRLLVLRKEYASLLGFDSWADYMAQDKMVKSATNIRDFIGEVAEVARPRMDKDLAVLLKRKRKDAPKAKAVQVWDRFYYVQTVKKETYGFDAQSVRPYFEFGAVTKGLMDLYGELFGVRFEPDSDAKPWHPSVSAWKLFEGDALVGRFFLDMHPRDGKYQHAAMFPLRVGLAGGAPPMASLVCNFPDPSASEGPALMEHDQVVTYFHEFGHLVHHLLSTGSPWANQAGINVEWDFVEAPSQLLEEWAWDVDVLQRFAKHVDTGEPIPAGIVEKMKASDEFGIGVHVMRQVYLTALSFNLHVAPNPSEIELVDFQTTMIDRYMPYPHVEGTHQYASFGHLNGYSSQYYTYQWSLTLAKDIFTRFEEAGLLDKEVARAYLNEILRPGGTQDAADLVEAFLGREPNLEAYREWLSGQ